MIGGSRWRVEVCVLHYNWPVRTCNRADTYVQGNRAEKEVALLHQQGPRELKWIFLQLISIRFSTNGCNSLHKGCESWFLALIPILEHSFHILHFFSPPGIGSNILKKGIYPYGYTTSVKTVISLKLIIIDQCRFESIPAFALVLSVGNSYSVVFASSWDQLPLP